MATPKRSTPRDVPPGMVSDGPVWCEACGVTVPSKADWAVHKEICPRKHRLIEQRGVPHE